MTAIETWLASKSPASLNASASDYVINGYTPPLVLDPVNDVFRSGGVADTLPAITDFARNTTAAYHDSAGDFQIAGLETQREDSYHYRGSSWENMGLTVERYGINRSSHSDGSYINLSDWWDYGSPTIADGPTLLGRTSRTLTATAAVDTKVECPWHRHPQRLDLHLAQLAAIQWQRLWLGADGHDQHAHRRWCGVVGSQERSG